MHKLLIAAAVVAAALSVGAAAAQIGQGEGRFAAMFAMADVNHDGAITRAEFDATRATRFTQLDADHSASLSATERPRWGGGEAQPAAAGAQHLRGDANGDGAVSRAEWDGESARMFNRLDADNNGAITQAELQAAQQRMQTMQH